MGLSVGFFFLLLFIGLPICIFGIVFCVSANRRRPTVRTQVVSTTSGGTTVVAANQSATSAHVNPPPPQQQIAYKEAPSSYTAAQVKLKISFWEGKGSIPPPPPPAEFFTPWMGIISHTHWPHPQIQPPTTSLPRIAPLLLNS